MRDNVFEHRLGSQNQSPAEGQVSSSRAASPTALGIAHIDPRHLAPDARGQPMRPRDELGPRRCNEMIADPARQVRGIAAHADFAVDDPDRGCGRIEFAADPMGHPEQRHDRTFDKRHRLRQGFEPRGDPSTLRRQKAQPRPRRNAGRQDQFDLAFGRVDPQPHPPRPRADPDRDRRGDPGFAVRGEPPAITLQLQRPPHLAP